MTETTKEEVGPEELLRIDQEENQRVHMWLDTFLDQGNADQSWAVAMETLSQKT